MPTHVLVLGDQLTRQVGPLARAHPKLTHVLMIESRALASAFKHHKQKLVLFFSAMRHFARDLQSDGFAVDYLQAESFETGIADYLRKHPGATLTMMRPSDWGYEDVLADAARQAGGSLEVLPNDLWLTTPAEFDEWAGDKKNLRLESFYRFMRRRTGWLMDGDEPRGGTWNFDAENRETPGSDHAFPEVLRLEPDELSREVMELVESTYPDHFGSVEHFNWPVTRPQALESLKDFCQNRLRGFGPYEDAMVTGQHALYHSLLSPAINMGLLTAKEVCETALEFAADGRRKIPLNSIEGFIRQILGWREFMYHVYRRNMPALRKANGLNHRRRLPWLYWSGATGMNCLRQTVRQLEESGHTHHIQRLMVLGNFALIAQVNPQELNDWFLSCYVDALDWVVTPNVLGMSQFADLGSFTSKPYAASANYINRMSDYCRSCQYDRKATVGEKACPFNSLYWNFIDRHSDRFAANPRMALVLRNWQKRTPETQQGIREQAERVKRALSDDRL